MDIQNILAHVDHTLLSPSATWQEIQDLCDDAIKYKTASVCIPPYYVSRAKEYVGDNMTVCTVIGFPNGYNTMQTKMFEAADAIQNGADELDMVINIGQLMEKNYGVVLAEIIALKKVCEDRVLKVIIETALLSDEEKIQMCNFITCAHADFIKTSTGFANLGATREDIKLFSHHIGSGVRMKASGGIRTLQDAQDYLELGCDRLGTSAIVKIAKEMNK